MNGFVAKQNEFEGPLDLLLTLIEKRKLFVNEVSLAKIADDFVAYLESHDVFPLAEGAQFVFVASTLVLIKSRSLLPQIALTTEEEQSIGDLENRLKQYQEIRRLSGYVSERFGKQILHLAGSRTREPLFTPDASMTTVNLAAAVQNLLQNLPKKEQLPKVVVQKIVSLEEMMGSLTKRIQSSLKMSFKDFAGVGREEKVNIIVGFLAMLELVKQGIVSVAQERHFDDITIETTEIGTPKYN